MLGHVYRPIGHKYSNPSKIHNCDPLKSKVDENSNSMDANISTTGADESETPKKEDLGRKVSVAVTGGAMIAAGIPLIPLPGPGDFMVVGGLAILATEFPAAQRVLDKGRDKLKDYAEGDDSEGEEEDDELEKLDENDKGYGSMASAAGVNDRGVIINGNKAKAADEERDMYLRVEDTTSTEKNVLGIGDIVVINEADCTEEHKNAFPLRAPTKEELARKMKKANKSLKKLVRGTILPMMDHVSSDNKIDSEIDGVLVENDNNFELDEENENKD